MTPDTASGAARDPVWLGAPRHFLRESHPPSDAGLLIDCDTCTVRGDACGECVVTFMLGCAPGPVELDPDERRALEVLGRSGLVPKLRLAPDPGAERAG